MYWNFDEFTTFLDLTAGYFQERLRKAGFALYFSAFWGRLGKILCNHWEDIAALALIGSTAIITDDYLLARATLMQLRPCRFAS